MCAVNLLEHQKKVLDKIKSGSILCGGVGTGKSITSLAYFYTKEIGGSILEDGSLTIPERPKDLYIITTAQKRDKFEWNIECNRFFISTDPRVSIRGIKLTVDSWNNIHKYVDVKDAFFILDEQRLVGSGAWVKSFYKIAAKNNWILLSATPGDTWMDYIPVFIANGFYRTRTEFIERHVVYDHHVKFPKVKKYLETARLDRLRTKIVVPMEFDKFTIPHYIDIRTEYDADLMTTVWEKRWNPYENKPIRDISNVCYLMRKVANTDPSKILEVRKLLKRFNKVILFYNFDYELEMLRELRKEITIAEWNGHKHDPIPRTDKWLYLVQYTAGAEGWNCIETNVIIFYSQNYSYKIMTQAAGRIDRLNTPFTDLYYFTLRSSSSIDISISKAIRTKQLFNEKMFVEKNRFA